MCYSSQGKLLLLAGSPFFSTSGWLDAAALLHHALPEHFGTEFLALKMAVKTVRDIQEAIAYIAENSSRHSEAIISEDSVNQQLFLSRIDAAAVYVNASTAFTGGSGCHCAVGILPVLSSIFLCGLIKIKNFLNQYFVK